MKDLDENGTDTSITKPLTKKKDLAEVAKMLEEEEKAEEKKPVKKTNKVETEEASKEE
ncbi:MAG: hypothetical protein LBD11_08305 [Candidatus Peribacteria bacterium]|jgi:hypothetical protein|nr:hypothetical protein [Candidatus Peribacteria bacterium]